MVRLPLDVLKPFDGDADVLEEDVIRRFIAEGYGRKRARFWIREFIDLNWIQDNKNGSLGINLPRTVVDKKNKKSGGFL